MGSDLLGLMTVRHFNEDCFHLIAIDLVQVTTYKVMTVRKGTVKRLVQRQETIPEQAQVVSPQGSNDDHSGTASTTPSRDDMMETWSGSSTCVATPVAQLLH